MINTKFVVFIIFLLVRKIMSSLVIILILAIVQGATEFLPISSSGHLVLLYSVFGIEDNTILLSVILHLATLLSVIIYYRKEIWKLITNPFCKTNIAIILTTIVTCVMALILKPLIEDSFGGSFLSISFAVTAVVLFISQILANNKLPSRDIRDLNISPTKALIIGLSQGIACFPGISRSGSTIATGLLLKNSKEDVTTYSFLISIPIIIASTVLEVAEYIKTPSVIPFSVLELIIGFVVATFAGLLAIKLMTTFVKKQKLYYFSFYLLILAIITCFVM